MSKSDFIENVSALAAFPFFLFIIPLLYFFNLRTISLQLLGGMIIGHVLTYAIRMVYPKERPLPKKYGSLYGKVDASSFPSLHTVRAMTFSVILAANLRSIAAYLLLSLYMIGIAYSRHSLKKHYLSDILAGAFLGLLIGLSILWFFTFLPRLSTLTSQ